MIIQYLYFYNQYHKKWIKGPFTQEQITRYASSCAYSVTKGLQEQMNINREEGELLKNSSIGIHDVDVPCGMRNFCSKVRERDERWFYFYWHAAGFAHKEGCKPRFDYFRTLCLQFWFVEKLPTFEQYDTWSNMWDETYGGSFKKELLRVRRWMDSQNDPKYHRQFKWIDPNYKMPRRRRRYSFKRSSGMTDYIKEARRKSNLQGMFINDPIMQQKIEEAKFNGNN